MTRIDAYIERELLDEPPIITYRTDAVAPSSVVEWTNDMLGVVAEQRGETTLLLLYDVSVPKASLSYMVLTEQDVLHPGITRAGRMRLEQILDQHPRMQIYFALLVSNSITEQVIHRYNAIESPEPEQVTAKMFIDEREAVAWLAEAYTDKPPTGPLTRPIDRAWVKAATGDLDTEDGEIHFGNRDEIIFLLDENVVSVGIPPNKTVIVGRNVAGRQNSLVHLNLSDHPHSLSVSRQHARIDLRNETLYITDLHSTNGTLVGGQVINPGTPRLIRNLDVIQVGEVRFSVVF